MINVYLADTVAKLIEAVNSWDVDVVLCKGILPSEHPLAGEETSLISQNRDILERLGSLLGISNKPREFQMGNHLYHILFAQYGEDILVSRLKSLPVVEWVDK